MKLDVAGILALAEFGWEVRDKVHAATGRDLRQATDAERRQLIAAVYLPEPAELVAEGIAEARGL